MYFILYCLSVRSPGSHSIIREAVISYLVHTHRTQGLCESRGGRPGLSVPNSRNGFYGRKATLNSNLQEPQSLGAV